jgi:hypothetical protein
MVRLANAGSTFTRALETARVRLAAAIAAKLDDFFELSEYDFTPTTREAAPSMYLYELVNWLTTVVDALGVREADKDAAYRGAIAYIAECLMVCTYVFERVRVELIARTQGFLTGLNVPMINENAISNILVDVDFLDDELKRINRGHLSSVFTELRSVRSYPFSMNCTLLTCTQLTSIPMADTVQEYLVPGVRQASYETVQPRKLRALLDKLARFGATCRDSPSREKGEKRRKEAEAVGRLVVT